MELKAMTCAKCGAKLNMLWYPSVLSCDYCGTSYIATDKNVTGGTVQAIDKPVDITLRKINHECIEIIRKVSMYDKVLRVPTEMELVGYSALSYATGQKIRLRVKSEHHISRTQEGVASLMNVKHATYSYRWTGFADEHDKQPIYQKDQELCNKMKQMGFDAQLKLDNFNNENEDGTTQTSMKTPGIMSLRGKELFSKSVRCYRQFGVTATVVGEKVFEPKDFLAQKEFLDLLHRMMKNEATKGIAEKIAESLSEQYAGVLKADPNKVGETSKLATFFVDLKGVTVYLKTGGKEHSKGYGGTRYDFHSLGMNDLGNDMMKLLFKAALASNVIAKTAQMGVSWYLSDAACNYWDEEYCTLALENVVEKKYKDW